MLSIHQVRKQLSGGFNLDTMIIDQCRKYLERTQTPNPYRKKIEQSE